MVRRYISVVSIMSLTGVSLSSDEPESCGGCGATCASPTTRPAHRRVHRTPGGAALRHRPGGLGRPQARGKVASRLPPLARRRPPSPVCRAAGHPSRLTFGGGPGSLAREVGADSARSRPRPRPYGRRRDAAVRASSLARAWPRGDGHGIRDRSGHVLTGGGTPYRCSRRSRGPGEPTGRRGRPPRRAAWLAADVPSDDLPAARLVANDVPSVKPPLMRRWRAFLGGCPHGTTASDRDRPDLDGTSRLSEALKFGEMHPRTLLADLGRLRAAGSPGAGRFVTELAWREFYADVLWHHPDSAWATCGRCRDGVRRAGRAGFDAWREGRTGFRSSTPGCASSLATAGCTTGCGWSRRASSSRTCTCGGRTGPGTSWRTSGRGPRLQLAWLAMGCGHRHRRGAVLPGLQPGRAGVALRPATVLCAPLGARAGPPARRHCPRAVAPPEGYAAWLPRADPRPRSGASEALRRYAATRTLLLRRV
jgi:hypothetical protein